MSSPSPGKRRMDTDVVKLIESNHEVTILGGLNEFVVKFFGPKETPYEGGIWKIRVDLPDKYPFKSPSIGTYVDFYCFVVDVQEYYYPAEMDIQSIFNNFNIYTLMTFQYSMCSINLFATHFTKFKATISYY